MGHYDRDYEETDARERQARQAEISKFGKDVRGLRAKVPQAVPQRFKDQLEDLQNWLDVNGKG